ncbi:MAG: cytochrome c3 family protein [Polyangiaceae bacterium]
MMRPSALFAAHVSLGIVTVAAQARSPEALPGPAPQLRRESIQTLLQRNRGCEHCHQEIAREWRQSRHRVAFTNDEFQEALQREPKATREFCVRCHAPERRLGAESSSSALGVACVTCHTPLGPVLATPAAGGRPAPHAVLRTASLSNGEACASCHEFAFPHPNQGLQMQRTMSEHRAAAGPDTGCNSCHMPRRDGHRSHAFPGGHDEALVKSSLKIRVTRPVSTQVRLRLTPHNTTHAVPTGDLFRRIAILVTTPGGFRHERFLTRHFEDAATRRERLDDRVYRAPRVIDVFLPKSAVNDVIHYRVTYDRVASVRPDRDDEAKLDGQIVLTEGTLSGPR